MNESPALSIGALARATGVPAETLRTWERRYGRPRAIRKPSGQRTYPASSVEHLRRVALLLARGHRPAEVLTLPEDALESLLDLSNDAEPRSEGNELAPDALEALLGDMLKAAGRLDRRAMMGELRTGWSRLGPVQFLDGCAGAFLDRVGKAWQAGELQIRHEHFASAVVSDFLREVREPYDSRARGPRTVLATLPGDAHQGGLLLASVLLAVRGWRVVYLGADTPVSQIADAARAADAAAVAVSVSSSLPRPRAQRALAALRAALPRRTALWTGGAGAPDAAHGIERLDSIAAFDARLARRG